MASISFLVVLASLSVAQVEHSPIGEHFSTETLPLESSEIFVDSLGYEYTQRWRNGLVDRKYLHPERRAVAWETHNHLQQIGLPDTRPTLSPTGVDALGRSWQRDDLGYPYYIVGDNWNARCIYYQPEQREAAAWAREQYSALDWSGAVRNGVSGAVVRAFNLSSNSDVDSKPSSAPEKFDPELDVFRDAVHHAVVTGINHAGSHEIDLRQFQKLIEAGIEDAIIQGFNAAGKSPIASLPSPAKRPQDKRRDKTERESNDQPHVQPLPAPDVIEKSIVEPQIEPTPAEPRSLQGHPPSVYSLPKPARLDRT